ncbi:hypothetical protein JR316_0002088 [Psilocybe cubensis]|uniref:Uncharacterized protein n=2 Tax=Psilocybe cubensis TaxID=181762 RepID=A0A8H8CPZ0_PSICU|nr:hypothetical protein JR316_0002088 [Psilocybe cubensis]KAH9485181.1 hypothetical protein JR316_0002088 [Psilocybe cubensis]
MTTNLSHEIPALFIPDDSTPFNPISEVNIPYPPSSQESNAIISQLLKCPGRVAEPLYSEDLLAVYNGSPSGVPPKQKFYVYDAYMDDTGNSTRPYNTRAAELLQLPRSYGPILIVKGVCVKDSEIGAVRVIDQEPLSEAEIESRAFRDKRKLFIEKQDAYKKRLFDKYRNDGFTVISS